MKRMILLAAALLIGAAASAQRLSVATNLLDYADFGTLNVEGDVAVARQWTLTAGAKYNPFLFKADTPEPLSARQQLYAAGVRFWPWHVFSGWWIGGKVQYQEYNRGGIRSAAPPERLPWGGRLGRSAAVHGLFMSGMRDHGGVGREDFHLTERPRFDTVLCLLTDSSGSCCRCSSCRPVPSRRTGRPAPAA